MEFKMFFKGAGILFYKKIKEDNLILLGKRNVYPELGVWSIPGGKINSKEDKNFLECALRETREEVFFFKYKEFLKIKEMIHENDYYIKIPLIFEYHTFLYNISDVDISFRKNYEFSRIKWFKINKLPRNTHFGVKYAINKHFNSNEI
jgi:ADP-ribose pyrophosphatase YjhB (NUDIX family)